MYLNSLLYPVRSCSRQLRSLSSYPTLFSCYLSEERLPLRLQVLLCTPRCPLTQDHLASATYDRFTNVCHLSGRRVLFVCEYICVCNFILCVWVFACIVWPNYTCAWCSQRPEEALGPLGLVTDVSELLRIEPESFGRAVSAQPLVQLSTCSVSVWVCTHATVFAEVRR